MKSDINLVTGCEAPSTISMTIDENGKVTSISLWHKMGGKYRQITQTFIDGDVEFFTDGIKDLA